MVMSDSSTGGSLLPSDPNSYYDVASVYDEAYTPSQTANALSLSGAAFNKILHDWLMGLTGLPGNMIMPRWQIVPPNLPDSNVTDWMTFGVTRKERPGGAYIRHQPGDSAIGLANGYDQNVRWENFSLLCSIYGPNQEFTETSISQGLFINQNNEQLLLNQIRPLGTDTTVIIPELIKSLWITRWDLSINLSRQIVFNYAIENLLSAVGFVETDSGIIETVSTTGL